MRLMQQHTTEGPGLIVVQSPDLGVFINVGETTTRTVDILADRGLGARVWSSGRRDEVMNLEVGRPTFLTPLKNLFGRKPGSSVVGGGTVISAGSGSIAAGGSITGCCTGEGATVFSKESKAPTEPGVHLSVPLRCTFHIKSAPSIAVRWCSAELTLEAAEQHGILEIKR